MGFVGQSFSSVSSSFAEVDGDSQSSRSGADVHGSSSGEVETTLLEYPTVGVPRPACNWVVDNRRPNKDKQEQWTEF
jgi:hypothetical protein